MIRMGDGSVLFEDGEMTDEEMDAIAEDMSILLDMMDAERTPKFPANCEEYDKKYDEPFAFPYGQDKLPHNQDPATKDMIWNAVAFVVKDVAVFNLLRERLWFEHYVYAGRKGDKYYDSVVYVVNMSFSNIMDYLKEFSCECAVYALDCQLYELDVTCGLPEDISDIVRTAGDADDFAEKFGVRDFSAYISLLTYIAPEYYDRSFMFADKATREKICCIWMGAIVPGEDSEDDSATEEAPSEDSTENNG